VKARTKFRCQCGKIVIATNTGVKSGTTRSCGCLYIKHGHNLSTRKSGTYNSWANMIQRCTTPNKTGFKNYGGRGITVCERWRTFANFLEDMGERPAGCTIERINNDGNYEPGNCKWETRKKQARNKRTNRLFTIDGFTGILQDVTAHFQVPLIRTKARLSIGWELRPAFFAPWYTKKNSAVYRQFI